MMEKAVFYSYKPCLYICLHRKRGIAVQFDKNCMCTLTGKNTINLLQEYAESTRNSYVTVEAGKGIGPEELKRLRWEWENNLITEAEKREKKRQEIEQKVMKQRDLSELFYR